MNKLYLVTSESDCRHHSLASVIQMAAEGGVGMVQLREKNASTREFIQKGLLLKTLLKPFNIPLIINDRVDVALAVEAEGVHLGQSDMPVESARRLLPPNSIVGLSVESLEEVKEAENLPVDYLGVSPVFGTQTKTDTKIEWGLDGLQHIRQISKHRLVAIGGISITNAEEVLKAGADDLALVSAICGVPDPKLATAEFIKIIKEYAIS
ncbi:thiamine phosphate synthase [Limibacter armeniacum]|uniref:thiamine phosphate synthase n=1 Tax=Limibacter armeniacum TaxID=466084 RepID=UPI002FE6765A